MAQVPHHGHGIGLGVQQVLPGCREERSAAGKCSGPSVPRASCNLTARDLCFRGFGIPYGPYGIPKMPAVQGFSRFVGVRIGCRRDVEPLNIREMGARLSPAGTPSKPSGPASLR